MENTDTYKTIKRPSEEALFKDRGSKFLGYAYPIQNEDEVKPIIESLKSQHHKARHWCYAWQIGVENVQYRVNDDGEPNNSAGQPIYGQILSKELTNVLVVVVRYFGGTKLGVGGLVNAYKTSAQMTLESSKVIVKTIDVQFKISFGYAHMNTVMRTITTYGATILEQKMELKCEFIIAIRKSEAEKVKDAFEGLKSVRVLEV
ncbi:YigZ family protein [Aureibaculum sp. 2210JD6-5]|uniref:IMPACT family protein n=1 Tax=Aureibaculum sp. 2210JD6-5 TaxID=3103957 RepID=UPI002AACE11E|nr:YigZ family protein [Aureibaculum sp. 2210JD6-5]MDY7393740.1 YigZ family protein [Aureibaculum sp. 2210JD6-5]